MINQRRIKLAFSITLAAALLTVLAVALPWLVVEAQEAPETPRTVPPVTDSVQFNADLGPQTLQGQYAWTSINNVVEAESVYNTVPQGKDESSNACAYGGAGEGCMPSDDAANARTFEGTMEPINAEFELLNLLGIRLGVARANAAVTEKFTTGVQCYLDENGRPKVSAQQPTGVIRYSGAGLLGNTGNETLRLEDVPNGEPISDNLNISAVLGLAGNINIDVIVKSSWKTDEENLRAYSQVTASYTARDGQNVKGSETFTARSECGMKMSDGTGSEGPGGAEPAAARAMMLAAPETTTVTSASGSPQSLGFTTEDTLLGGAADYHLLATRELDLLDRLVIEEVLAEVSETGAVEGSNWKLFDAATAGELVPVLELQLHDGAVVQVRPIIGGVVLPSPDLIELTPTTTVETATVSDDPAPESTESESTESESTVSESAAPETVTATEPAPTTTSGE